MSKCYGCMKFGVIFVAFIFVLAGLAVIGLSTYLLLDRVDGSYLDLTNDDIYLQYGKIFLLVAGALMLLGGVLGCCGGFRQSSACLSLFLAIVLIISMAELAAGVYAYVHRDDFLDYFRKSMEISVKTQYRRDEIITDGWNYIQTELKCCGATSYRDYHGSKSDTVDMTISAPDSAVPYTIPASCCADRDGNECTDIKVPSGGDLPVGAKIYREGCSEKLIALLKEQIYWIIGTLIIVGSVQILCLLFTCILICAFRSRRTYKN